MKDLKLKYTGTKSLHIKGPLASSIDEDSKLTKGSSLRPLRSLVRIKSTRPAPSYGARKARAKA